MKNMESYVIDYKNGMYIKDISLKYNVSENEIRNVLKTNLNWYSRSVSELSQEEIEKIITSYKSEVSIIEIADIFNISAPSIIKLLRASGINRIYHKGRKYDILKASPFTHKNKEFIVGTMLGDGCIRKSGKIPRLCIVHSKKFELYFHWKIAQLDKYFNLWREQIHPRKNSTLLYSETLQHNGLIEFYNKFYINGKKIVPDNIEEYITPYGLAIWFMDDGTLNNPSNQRIHTNSFKYEDQVKLQNLLKINFDLECKILTRKDGQHILSFNSKNSKKMTEIIRPYVIPSMTYKLVKT